jgi:hypothetical protein
MNFNITSTLLIRLLQSSSRQHCHVLKPVTTHTSGRRTFKDSYSGAIGNLGLSYYLIPFPLSLKKSYQGKEDEMGEACGSLGGGEGCIQHFGWEA